MKQQNVTPKMILPCVYELGLMPPKLRLIAVLELELLLRSPAPPFYLPSILSHPAILSLFSRLLHISCTRSFLYHSRIAN